MLIGSTLEQHCDDRQRLGGEVDYRHHSRRRCYRLDGMVIEANS